MCQRIDKLKYTVQELQRDLTLRRCLIKTSAVSDLQEEITDLQKDLDDLFILTDKKQPALEKVSTRIGLTALPKISEGICCSEEVVHHVDISRN